MAIGDTCIGEWDVYFLLRSIQDGGTYHVDIIAGTREYDTIMVMRDHGQLFVSFGDGYIERIAATPKGISHYQWCVDSGYFTNEELGLQITYNLIELWQKQKGNSSKKV